MRKRKMSPRVHKKGVLKALRSPRTPRRLKAGLRKYARKRGWIK